MTVEVKTYPNFYEAFKDNEGAEFSELTEDMVKEIDFVNKPPHYDGPCECIDAMKYILTPEEFQGYLKGNAFKYLWRHNYKGKAKEDMSKARWYMDRSFENDAA